MLTAELSLQACTGDEKNKRGKMYESQMCTLFI